MLTPADSQNLRALIQIGFYRHRSQDRSSLQGYLPITCLGQCWCRGRRALHHRYGHKRYKCIFGNLPLWMPLFNRVSVEKSKATAVRAQIGVRFGLRGWRIIILVMKTVLVLRWVHNWLTRRVRM
jgi:hypothetical protein